MDKTVSHCPEPRFTLVAVLGLPKNFLVFTINSFDDAAENRVVVVKILEVIDDRG